MLSKIPNSSITNTQYNVYTQKNPSSKNTPQISFNSNGYKKNKISTRKKLITTIGIVGLGIGVAALLLKGKTQEAKKLASHIDFKEAKTLDEAIMFAKTNLGVELQNMQHLNVANAINEHLAKLNNKVKGSIKLPKAIKIKEMSLVAGRYNPINDTVYLSSKNWGEYFSRDLEKLRNTPQFKHLFYDRIDTLYHEIGHKIHIDKKGLLKTLYPSKSYKKQVDAIKETLLKFLGDGYDTTSREIVHLIDNPGETFSQIFAKNIMGNTPSGKIADLYENLGGTIYK